MANITNLNYGDSEVIKIDLASIIQVNFCSMFEYRTRVISIREQTKRLLILKQPPPVYKMFDKKRTKRSASGADTQFYSSQECLRPILAVMMLVGSFPVNNLWSKFPDKLKSEWVSVKMIYTFVVSFGLLVCAVMALHKAMMIGSFINQLSESCFAHLLI